MNTMMENETATMMSLMRTNEKLEDLRLKLNEPIVPLSNDAILILCTELQPLYKKLIMSNLDGAVHRQLENFMWNDCFKTPLTRFGRTDKALFNVMIESGVGFYLGLIQDVGMHFDIPFIKNTARTLYCTTPYIKNVKNSPSKTSVYYIIQNSLVHVGDLLRYRGSFAEALKMYEKSAAVSPSNGHPFHQMGLGQMLIDSKSVDSLLSGVYYYTRALCVSNPYVAAQQNLENLFGRIKLIKPTTKVDDFLCQFLLGAGKPESTQLQPSSYVPQLSPLVTMGSITDSQLFRVICIGLWTWKRESDKTLLAVESSCENYALEIIAALINSILIAAIGFPDVTTFFALPHLKIVIDWLHCNTSVLNNDAFRSKLHNGTLCKLLNQLVPLESRFSVTASELEYAILPEEKRMLGFLPMVRCYDNLQSLIDESDMRIIALRVCRTLKSASSLAQPRLGFIERNCLTGMYSEIPFLTKVPSVIRAPSRRNVALQSIFQQITPAEATGAAAEHMDLTPEPGLPVSARTTPFGNSDSRANSVVADSFKPLVFCESGSYGYDSASSSMPTASFLHSTPDLTQSEDTSQDYTQIFRSIWTPFQSEADKNVDGWKS